MQPLTKAESNIVNVAKKKSESFIFSLHVAIVCTIIATLNVLLSVFIYSSGRFELDRSAIL